MLKFERNAFFNVSVYEKMAILVRDQFFNVDNICQILILILFL